jgi:hypothetical protein
MLQLISEDAESGSVVIMEDSDSDSYVAIGEVMASDYTPERFGDGTEAIGDKIRVILKSVWKPNTILPFEVRGPHGEVLCIFTEKGSIVVVERHGPNETRRMHL